MTEPQNEVGAAWRRGIMHAVETLDMVIPPSKPVSKRDAPAALARVRKALDDLTAFQRMHFPTTYAEAFDVSNANLKTIKDQPHD